MAGRRCQAAGTAGWQLGSRTDRPVTSELSSRPGRMLSYQVPRLPACQPGCIPPPPRPQLADRGRHWQVSVKGHGVPAVAVGHDVRHPRQLRPVSAQPPSGWAADPSPRIHCSAWRMGLGGWARRWGICTVSLVWVQKLANAPGALPCLLR